jgi:RND family efflux transporter MFP subunit
MVDQLSRQVEIYPIRIREAQASLASARASLETARANLDRCEVRAFFKGRIKTVFLEKGQYVSPGTPALTLADDSVLEIQVPLDSRDAREWLRFNGENPVEDLAWFSGVDPVACRVRWTEDRAGNFGEGQMHRVVNFDPQTRTVTVAVRVGASAAVSRHGIPLVEGMFCVVEIPGKPLKGVIRLPRWAVSFKNTVYTAVGNRLKTVPVTVARVEGEEAFISEGLRPGERIIVTRLVDPLENALLEMGQETEDPL